MNDLDALLEPELEHMLNEAIEEDSEDTSWSTSDEVNFLNNIPKLYRERVDPDEDNPVDKDVIIGLYLNYRKSMLLRKSWQSIEPVKVKKRLQCLLDNLRKRKSQYISVRDAVYR